jgi:hypothetical protein
MTFQFAIRPTFGWTGAQACETGETGEKIFW